MSNPDLIKTMCRLAETDPKLGKMMTTIPFKSSAEWGGGGDIKIKICCSGGAKRIVIPCLAVKNTPPQNILYHEKN